MEASQPKAPQGWRTPRRYRAIHRFMVPMHAEKNERGLSMNRKVGRAVLSPPAGPRRGEDTAPYPLARFRQPWESGAKGPRTPNASRLPGVSEPREASGVRPIYRRFLPRARRPKLLGPNARGQTDEEEERSWN